MKTTPVLLAILMAAVIGLPLLAAANEYSNEPAPFTDIGENWKRAESGEKMAPMASLTGSEETIDQAINLFDEALQDPQSRSIPGSTIENAQGIAIFPAESASTSGGGFSSGVMLSRQDDGEWSPPLFVSLSGASQVSGIGASPDDLVLVFNDHDVVEKAATSRDFTLGRDASVAEGEVGQAPTTEMAQIVAFKRDGGSFDGATVNGTVLNVEQDRTIAYYNMESGERGASGYYANPSMLYNDVIEYQSQDIKRFPDSATRLQQILEYYTTRSRM